MEKLFRLHKELSNLEALHMNDIQFSFRDAVRIHTHTHMVEQHSKVSSWQQKKQ